MSATMESAQAARPDSSNRVELEDLTVRFAGDSGDGMQVTGGQFTGEIAMAGSDFATFPDFPAEIRAPAGTTFGVSAFQIHFGSKIVHTEGDEVDILVAFNPAALKTNLEHLRDGGMVVVNTSTFSDKNLNKAGYQTSPLEDDGLKGYSVLPLDIEKMTLEAVSGSGVSNREAHRCKNFWALGLVLWMCDFSRDTVLEWMQKKFAAQPKILAANMAAVNAGHAFGETAELGHTYPLYHVAAAQYEPGLYRNVSGTEALCWGLLTGARLADVHLTYCSYPITPASAMLHMLSRLEDYGATTFQAEDEIAAVCAAIGASYAGDIGITGTSGPGMALKTEALGLACATELPLVVINTQRGGPSTGLPTKTEQSDLFQAVLGRNADSPLIVIAAKSASDGFDCAVESVRLAIKYMTPVVLLTDGYLANAAEPWRVPDLSLLEPLERPALPAADEFQPYLRDPKTGARPWVAPGTRGMTHRIGGLERDAVTGNVSYEPANHQRMTDERIRKIAGAVADIPDQTVEIGEQSGDLLVLGWGSTHGAIYTAVAELRAQGHKVSSAHLRYICPLPKNLGELLGQFTEVLVPELNAGQLVKLLRAEYAMDLKSLTKVAGQPFKISEIERAVLDLLKSKAG